MNIFVEKKTAVGKPFKPQRHIPEGRTKEKYPIVSDPPKFENDEAAANYYGRLLAWEVSRKRTKHLQENIQMIVDFLNEEWKLVGENKIIGNTVHHSNFSLWTENHKLTFDLKKGKIEKNFFLENVKEVTGKDIQSNSEARMSLQNQSTQILTESPKTSGIETKEDALEKIEEITPEYLDLEIELPDEIIESESLSILEGAKKQIIVNAYERNPKARRICIEKYGAKCSICEFDFNKFYGKEIAESYIHVHHLKQLSNIGEEYEVDPILDLRPVCPNCHAIIHRRKKAYSIDEVKQFIENQRRLNDNCH
ncbi:MAG: hypothetical protein M3367_07165 [Acidobacteriota bacterium]|nr:hypothetical protein [Acidobacteriota bacterium]